MGQIDPTINPKVLIVDDEYFTFDIFKRAWSNGFDLQFVGSGQACLDRAIIDPPDHIFLDICMPGLDGYDTCRILKNTPETKHIPVYIMSGLESDDARVQAFKAGCDGYYTKPLSLNEIADSLRQK